MSKRTLKEWLSLQNKLSTLVREAQDRGDIPTVRELARKMRVPNKVVLTCAEDLCLNVNVGIQTGAGIYVEKFVGSHTVEDLDYPLMGA